MKKIRVAVLMGGKSPEYEVSLSSGEQVVKNLDREKYEVSSVKISKDGEEWGIQELLGSSGSDRRKSEVVLGKEGVLEILKRRVDVVFIAMHGPYGEDGVIQAILDYNDITYTGSGMLASALGISKIFSRKVWASDSLPTVPFNIVRRKEDLPGVSGDLGYPFVLKPADQGSSVGVSIVEKSGQISKAWDVASQFGGEVIAEPYVDGVEVTCGVLGNDKPVALPPIEIVPVVDSFYSYKAKYEEGGSEHIIPPRVPKKAIGQIGSLAVEAFLSLGCRGFGRVDGFVVRDNFVISEINTIPGLTPTSLLPDAASAKGISYPQLLDKIIRYALE